MLKLFDPNVRAVLTSGKSDSSSPIEIPVRVGSLAADEMDEPIDVDFQVIDESLPIGVLVAETYEPEGPRSSDPRIDRHLAPIRQAKLEAERREQLKRLIEAQRRLFPPWWTRLWRTAFRKPACLIQTGWARICPK